MLIGFPAVSGLTPLSQTVADGTTENLMKFHQSANLRLACLATQASVGKNHAQA
jgi:hypothetical protein